VRRTFKVIDAGEKSGLRLIAGVTVCNKDKFKFLAGYQLIEDCGESEGSYFYSDQPIMEAIGLTLKKLGKSYNTGAES